MTELIAGAVNGLRYWRHVVRERDRLEATLPDLVTTRQAAALIGVTEARVRRWACDGVLTRYGRVNGVAYYDQGDVIRVERAMRTRRDQDRITGNVRRAALDDH